MRKGKQTKETILAKALAIASTNGLEDLNFGGLAKAVEMSKSGLFAHFGSKEELQLQVMEAARARFIEIVIGPAMRVQRGESRIRAIFDHWQRWEHASFLPGGCPFAGIAAEVDDRPGPVRDRLVSIQRDWLEFMASAAHAAVDCGHFRPDTDTEQFAFDFQSLMLTYHHYSRLLRHSRTVEFTSTNFEGVLARYRNPS